MDTYALKISKLKGLLLLLYAHNQLGQMLIGHLDHSSQCHINWIIRLTFYQLVICVNYWVIIIN